MLKHEFEAILREMTGREYRISDEWYAKIEFCYMNCPLFFDTNGKGKIANFFFHEGYLEVERLHAAITRIFQAMRTGANYVSEYSAILDIAHRWFNGNVKGYKIFYRQLAEWATENQKNIAEQQCMTIAGLPQGAYLIGMDFSTLPDMTSYWGA